MTTLDRGTLARLGIEVPRDAPRASFRIASGDVVDSQLVLLDRVHLGGYVVEGVTAGVCDRCREEDGLLGLNVSGQFRVTVDPDAGELELAPIAGVPERLPDVRRWLDVGGFVRAGKAAVTAHNRSSRRVDEARVLLTCPDGGAEVVMGAIPPLGSASATAAVPASCRSLRIDITSALW